jgi:hypothetical protein
MLGIGRLGTMRSRSGRHDPPPGRLEVGSQAGLGSGAQTFETSWPRSQGDKAKARFIESFIISGHSFRYIQATYLFGETAANLHIQF